MASLLKVKRLAQTEDLGVLLPPPVHGERPGSMQSAFRAKLTVTVPTDEPRTPSTVRLNGNHNCFTSFLCFEEVFVDVIPCCQEVSDRPDNSVTLTSLRDVFLSSVSNQWQAMSVLTILFFVSAVSL